MLGVDLADYIKTTQLIVYPDKPQIDVESDRLSLSCYAVTKTIKAISSLISINEFMADADLAGLKFR